MVNVRKIWYDSIRMKTISGQRDGFRMGSTIDQGCFDSLFDAMSHYAENRHDGWNYAANISIDGKGALALPMPGSLIIENNRIFDWLGQPTDSKNLMYADTIIVAVKRGNKIRR